MRGDSILPFCRPEKPDQIGALKASLIAGRGWQCKGEPRGLLGAVPRFSRHKEVARPESRGPEFAESQDADPSRSRM
jgi:hypothetical protein